MSGVHKVQRLISPLIFLVQVSLVFMYFPASVHMTNFYRWMMLRHRKYLFCSASCRQLILLLLIFRMIFSITDGSYSHVGYRTLRFIHGFLTIFSEQLTFFNIQFCYIVGGDSSIFIWYWWPCKHFCEGLYSIVFTYILYLFKWRTCLLIFMHHFPSGWYSCKVIRGLCMRCFFPLH